MVNASRAKKLEKPRDPLALVAHTGSSSRSPSPYYVTHPSSVVDYDDDYQGDAFQNNSEDPLISAMKLLARAITQRFSNPTNNHLRTSSNTKNQAIVQGDKVNIQSQNYGNDGRNTQRSFVPEEIIEGHYARNFPKLKVQDSKYFMEQMLLAKQDEAGVTLTDEQNDFLVANASRMEEIEELRPSHYSAFLSEVQTPSTSYVNPLFAKDNQEQKYRKQPKIINDTFGDDQIDSNIIFDEPNVDVNSGSVEYDNNVQESYELEKLARNAYKKAEKQQIIAKKRHCRQAEGSTGLPPNAWLCHPAGPRSFGMGTLSLVLEYLKDLEECMDDGDLRVAKEAKLFDALEHKSVVIEKLSKLLEMSFGVPRIINLHLFDGYGFEDTLREMMKFEYIYEGDGDTFVDYSWERALSIDNEIYPEWLLEFFSTLYFDKDVDRNNLMKEKLEVNDKQFDHKDYWTRVGKPTLTKHKEVLVKEPLMQIVHKVIMGSLVHRVASRERYQKQDLWMMSALEESRGVNLGLVIFLTKEIEEKIKMEYGKTRRRSKHQKMLDEPNGWVTNAQRMAEHSARDGREYNRGPSRTTDKLCRAARGALSQLCSNLNRHKLSKLQERSFGVPRVANRHLFDGYGFEDTLREMMKLEYIYEGDGDIFVDYSWERALSINNEIYPEWVLELFSTLYFDKDVDRNNFNQRGSYGLGDDDYFTSAMQDFGGSSSGYAVGGSSRGAGFNDDDDMNDLKSMHLMGEGENLEKQVVVWKKPPFYTDGEPMKIGITTKKPEDVDTEKAEEEPARVSRVIPISTVIPITRPNPEIALIKFSPRPPLTDTILEFPVSKPETKIIGSSSGPMIYITLPEQPGSPPVAPKADRGKGVATDDTESPKKLVKDSTVVRPNPDAPILVPYKINGKIFQLTEEQIKAHMDKEEMLKKVVEEARLLAMSKPELIKVTAVKTILKYLRNTKDMVLVYGAKPEAKLKVSCAKQSTTSMSSTKVEYIVAAEASMEAVWMRKFIDGLSDVVPSNKRPMEMLCYNELAIAIANDPGILKGARHF
ncbi:hypothetical protein Tco_0562305 [Tanacetum coccineum]